MLKLTVIFYPSIYLLYKYVLSGYHYKITILSARDFTVDRIGTFAAALELGMYFTGEKANKL